MLGLVLVLLYAAIGAVSASQLLRIVYYGHRLRSYQFAFVSLTLLWAAFRVLFFAQTAHWPLALELAVYWLPTDLQMAMFSLFLVYFSFIADRASWDTRRRTLLPLYFVANAVFILLTTSYVAVTAANGELTPELDKAHHYFLAAQFLGLAALLGLYGSRLFRGGHATIGGRLGVLVVALGAVFFSRCVYNLVAAQGVWTLSVGDEDGGVKTVGPAVFSIFVAWEVVPPALVLVTFRDIPRTRLGGFGCLQRGGGGGGGKGVGVGDGGSGAEDDGGVGVAGGRTPLVGNEDGGAFDADSEYYDGDAIRDLMQPVSFPAFSHSHLSSEDDDEGGEEMWGRAGEWGGRGGG